MVLHEEIVINEDIRINIKTSKLKSSQKLVFHYWLNARFVNEGVGKVYTT